MTKYNPMSHGFHTHTMYGSIDAVPSASELIDRSLALGRDALTVTDHGSMAALPELWRENENRKKKGEPHLQIIHGIEPYVQSYIIPSEIELTKKFFHQTILFRNRKAFEWFSKKTIDSELQASVFMGNRRPIYSLEWMKEVADDIIVGSGCIGGIVQQLFLEGYVEEAEHFFVYLKTTFPHFFVEMMPHVLDQKWIPPVKDKGKFSSDGHFIPSDEDIQEKINCFMFNLAIKYKVPMVISEDSHLTDKKQKEVQDILLGNSWRFSCSYSMEETSVWAEVLKKQVQGIDDNQIHLMVCNSYVIKELCQDYTFKTIDDGVHLPTMKMIFGEDLPTIPTLIQKIKEHGLLPQDEPNKTIYTKRLKEEIDVLTQNSVADFIPYIFVVYDVVTHFRKSDGYASPRGSAAGSLILYLLGITIADPIKYNLSFGRFLTKGRIAEGNFPDIDLDCADQEGVYKYLSEKYKDKFCQISTDSVIKLKTAMKDTERVYKGSVSAITNFTCVKLPNPPQGVDDNEFVFGYETPEGHIPGVFDSDEEYSEDLRQWSVDNPKEWDTVVKCLGVVKTHGVHACACVITPDKISSILPLSVAKNGVVTSQYTHSRCEYIGGIKYDFLSLDTLKSIGETFKLIRENKGVNLIWQEFPIDEDVIKNIIKGDKLAGVFQMSAKALRPYVKKMPPKNIIEISNILALVRPGALDAPSPKLNAPQGETAAVFYVNCVNGKDEPFFIHEDLKEITGDTYSVILYQEQIMEIFQKFAGYDEGEAAAAMKAVSKKQKEKLEKHCNKLREGLQDRKWNEEQITFLINSVMASARYSFNKSHSLSYAINSYIECWLKHYYPLEYWCAKLTVMMDRSDYSDMFISFLPEIQEYIDVLDIKNCNDHKWSISSGKLIPPASIVKGVGENVAASVVEYCQTREWETFNDLLDVIIRDKEIEKASKKTENVVKYTTRMTVSNIATLMFHGFFDKYLPQEGKKVDIYNKTLADMRLKLKSTAEAKATTDIKTEIDLINFRLDKNPLFYIGTKWFIDTYKNNMFEMGFEQVMSRCRIFNKDNIDVLSTLENVFEKPSVYNMYKERERVLMIMGVVKEVTMKTSKKNTPFAIVKILLGENEYDLKLFCNRYTKTLDSTLLSIMQVNRVCLLDIQPDNWGGFKSGIIQNAFWLN